MTLLVMSFDAVRRIAVRSVLWEDILVEIPSNATMAEFRVSESSFDSYLLLQQEDLTTSPAQISVCPSHSYVP